VTRTTVETRDGVRLAATVTGTGDDIVLVNAAMAVPRAYYQAFAHGLARSGVTVLTYDYRGIGGSRPADLRGYPATASDWALLDIPAALDHARGLRSGRVFVVGHSFGGQVAGLADNAHLISAMVTLSSQSGYWRLLGRGARLSAAFHAHVTLPGLAGALGYFPWSRFSTAQDLPKGAALQWSRWARHPRYLLGDRSLPLERFAAFRAPVLAYSVDDDPWGTSRAVDALMAVYPNLTRRHLRPTEHGLAGLGHFGYFRRAAAALWHDDLAWLRASAGSAQSA
jgi:predicted alpha/beta hydrolase